MVEYIDLSKVFDQHKVAFDTRPVYFELFNTSGHSPENEISW